MTLASRLGQLEEPPYGCELVDLDLLLRECGYQCDDDGTIRVYHHEGWDSTLTFPSHKPYVPGKRLLDIIAFLRGKLRSEHRL